MTLSLLWEILFALAMGAVLVVLVTRSRRLDLTEEPGWKRIVAGFSLLFMAGLVDITDHFPSLGRFVVLGQTPYQAMLEKLGGFLLGSLMLAAGLYRWLPAISEGRQSEARARQRAESRLDRFFRLSLDLHCIANLDGYFKVVNPAFERLLGWTEEELLARPFLDFVHPDDRDVTAAELGTLGKGRETLYFENRYRCRDGSVRWLAWTAHPVPEEGLIYAAAHDVSPLKEQERHLADARDRAESASRAKSLFLATMSHELRTPLNSVIGFANVLAKNPRDHLDAEERDLADRIRNNGRHLLRLINEILDLSKVEAGKLELSPEPVDVRNLVEEVLDETSNEPRRPGVVVTNEIPADLAPVRADRGRLKQVLINLVGNAVKFTAEGKVTIRVLLGSKHSRPLAIEVHDTGPGIPEDQQEAIFEPFHQADQSWSRPYEGTGLGLAISRSLCTRMGFTLEVESAPDEGSVFRVGFAEHQDDATSRSRGLSGAASR